jgi:maltose O-acetyltransferase
LYLLLILNNKMNIFFQKLIKKSCVFLINTFLSTTKFFRLKRFMMNLSGFKIGKNTKIVGPFYIGTCAELIIGENCWIGGGLKVYGNGSVSISNNCDLAPDVAFVTGSHEIGPKERRAGDGISYKILIKEGCWIGARVTILGDITVCSSAIIGASSLVNKDIPSNVIVAGIPAKIIRDINV